LAPLFSCPAFAIAAYHDAPTWRALARNGMAKDFSWDASAREYARLYSALATGGSRRG
jgi:glycogen synthase